MVLLAVQVVAVLGEQVLILRQAQAAKAELVYRVASQELQHIMVEEGDLVVLTLTAHQLVLVD
jgi:hypothetical protein